MSIAGLECGDLRTVLCGKLDNIGDAWVVVVSALLLAPFFRPAIVQHLDTDFLQTIYFYGRVASVVFSVALFLLLEKKGAFFVCTCIFCLAPLVSTISFNGKIMIWFEQYLSFASIMLLSITFVRRRPKPFLAALCVVTSFLLVVNCVSALRHPEGLWGASQYFYGNRNGLYMLALPALGCSLMLDCMNGRTFGLRSLAIAVVAALMLSVSFSTTTFFALGLLVLSAVLSLSKTARNLLNGYTFVAVFFVLFFAIVVFRSQEHFAFLIEGVLGKSLSFSGRTPIWDIVMSFDGFRYIPLGHGIPSEAYISGPTLKLNAHNILLHIWYTGGFVTLGAFLSLLFITARSLFREREGRLAAIAAAMMGAFLLVGLMEAEPYPAFYCALAVAYAISSEVCRDR